MNKIVFPALLAATIMIAGAFAFMPVEQASTVHATGATTIAADAITAAKVAANAIGASELAADAVVEIQTTRIDTVAGAAGVDFSCTSTTPFVVHYNVANLADTQTLVVAGTSNAALTYTADVAANTTALELVSGTIGGAAGETVTFTLGAAGTSTFTIESTFGSVGTCA